MKQNAIELTKELLQGYCWPPLKETAEKWLDNQASDAEYTEVLKQAVMKLDDVIEMFSKPETEEHFGKEKAAAILAHAKDIKAKGEIYCDCPACSKARAIIKELE